MKNHYTEEELRKAINKVLFEDTTSNRDNAADKIISLLSSLPSSGGERKTKEEVLDNYLSNWFENTKPEYEGEISAVRNQILKAMDTFASQFSTPSAVEVTEERIEEMADESNGYLVYAKETKAPIFSEGFISGFKKCLSMNAAPAQIKLPSDEEIEKHYNSEPCLSATHSTYLLGNIVGAKWMRDYIKKQLLSPNEKKKEGNPIEFAEWILKENWIKIGHDYWYNTVSTRKIATIGLYNLFLQEKGKEKK